MTTTIESVDNLAKPPPHDRVNETERSSSEDQRRQFKKTLKETMQEDEDQEKDDQTADAVIIGQDQKSQKQNQHARQADGTEPPSGKAEGEQKDKTSAGGHIDLKA